MARDDEDYEDDEELDSYLAVYTDGTSEELLATDAAAAGAWAHAYGDGIGFLWMGGVGAGHSIPPNPTG